VEPAAVEGDRLALDRGESRHLLRVHRARPGARFEAVDGEGNTYHCVLETIVDGRALAFVERRERDRGELGADLHVIVGLPEPGGAEAVVEHAVPLGVRVLDFAACERSGRPPLTAARIDRLSRLARSGIKQSRRSRLPSILSSGSLMEALGAAPHGGRLGADPDGGILPEEWNERPQAPLTLAVGPPGGFAPRELEELRGAGFRFISLGPSRLTSQTAAIALLAVSRNLILHNRLRSI
jgi:16S rRNA (uracil1498-N3)-methyltransferase